MVNLPKRRPSGFTLIELMIVVAIVGVLSSVAIPAYGLLTIRSKTAERDMVAVSIKRGVMGMYLRDGKFDLVGADNPPDGPGVPGPSKMSFNVRLDAGWTALSEFVQMEGATYYQYSFTGTEPGTGSSDPSRLDITWAGDLDGDGIQSWKTTHYVRRDGQYYTDETSTATEWCEVGPGSECLVDQGTF